MRTQDDAQTTVVRPRREADTFPQARAGVPQARSWPAPPVKREEGRAASAPAPHGTAPPVQPCPERIWWFGVLVGGPLMLIGFFLTLTLFGAPLGIPLWAAGLGLMLSPRPCKD
jgi:hypothetical protein